jgi:hypothetical protein
MRTSGTPYTIELLRVALRARQHCSQSVITDPSAKIALCSTVIIPTAAAASQPPIVMQGPAHSCDVAGWRADPQACHHARNNLIRASRRLDVCDHSGRWDSATPVAAERSWTNAGTSPAIGFSLRSPVAPIRADSGRPGRTLWRPCWPLCFPWPPAVTRVPAARWMVVPA